MLSLTYTLLLVCDLFVLICEVNITIAMDLYFAV